MLRIYEVTVHPSAPAGTSKYHHTGAKLLLPEDFPIETVFGLEESIRLKQAGYAAIDTDLFQAIAKIVKETNWQSSNEQP